jgi:hypothetical protein
MVEVAEADCTKWLVSSGIALIGASASATSILLQKIIVN